MSAPFPMSILSVIAGLWFSSATAISPVPQQHIATTTPNIAFNDGTNIPPQILSISWAIGRNDIATDTLEIDWVDIDVGKDCYFAGTKPSTHGEGLTTYRFKCHGLCWHPKQ